MEIESNATSTFVDKEMYKASTESIKENNTRYAILTLKKTAFFPTQQMYRISTHT